MPVIWDVFPPEFAEINKGYKMLDVRIIAGNYAYNEVITFREVNPTTGVPTGATKDRNVAYTNKYGVLWEETGFVYIGLLAIEACYWLAGGVWNDGCNWDDSFNWED